MKYGRMERGYEKKGKVPNKTWTSAKDQPIKHTEGRETLYYRLN